MFELSTSSWPWDHSSTHLDPKHPPNTFVHTTKYLSVSTGAPGPMNFSHHPVLVLSWGRGVVSKCQITCWKLQSKHKNMAFCENKCCSHIHTALRPRYIPHNTNSCSTMHEWRISFRTGNTRQNNQRPKGDFLLTAHHVKQLL